MKKYFSAERNELLNKNATRSINSIDLHSIIELIKEIDFFRQKLPNYDSNKSFFIRNFSIFLKNASFIFLQFIFKKSVELQSLYLKNYIQDLFSKNEFGSNQEDVEINVSDIFMSLSDEFSQNFTEKIYSLCNYGKIKLFFLYF
jgi:hypothetical protein